MLLNNVGLSTDIRDSGSQEKEMTLKRAVFSVLGLAVMFGSLTSAQAQRRHCHYHHHHRVCRAY